MRSSVQSRATRTFFSIRGSLLRYMLRHNHQAMNPEKLIPRIFATPVRRPIAARRDGHDLPFKIDRFRFSREEIDSLQEFSDGTDDICEIEITGCNLVYHWRKQKEVVAVHERDLSPEIACQRVIEVNRRM